jgi:AhpD family alkylhydroperoxidase
MTKKYKETIADISVSLSKMRKEMPDTMNAFHALSQSATKDGALSKKTKELIALALGIAAHCDGCIGFHTQALVKLGVSREEFLETLSMAVYMGGGPSLMYAAEALSAFEEFMPTQA